MRQLGLIATIVLLLGGCGGTSTIGETDGSDTEDIPEDTWVPDGPQGLARRSFVVTVQYRVEEAVARVGRRT